MIRLLEVCAAFDAARAERGPSTAAGREPVPAAAIGVDPVEMLASLPPELRRPRKRWPRLRRLWAMPWITCCSWCAEHRLATVGLLGLGGFVMNLGLRMGWGL